MHYVLSFRDNSRNVGGPVLPGRLTLRDGASGRLALDALSLETEVKFLIHGFNVSLEEGTKSLLRFADHLPLNDVPGSALVATLWPGDHWSGGLSYSFQGQDADDAAFELSRFIQDNLRPSTPVSFAAHSLGARVALETVDRLHGTGFSVEQVCLLAPAVDDDSLGDGDVYRRAARSAERVGVLHSEDDGVLKWAYPVGDLLQAFFFWREESGLALGYHGPRNANSNPGDVPSNVIEKSLTTRGVGHGDYLPSDPANAEQTSAAAFADEQLSGTDSPTYP